MIRGPQLPDIPLATWLKARYFLYGLFGNYLVISVGTSLCEGWSIADGLYYGAMAMTTVGFGDLVPTTAAGRAIAIVLIPLGIVQLFGVGFMTLQEMVRTVVNRRDLTMVRPGIKDHYIVCGYGKIGQVVVQTLLNQKKPLCVVELDPLKSPELEEMGIDHVIGDALRIETLEEAGLERSACAVCTFDNDAHNVYVVLEIRDRYKDKTIIATASSAAAGRRLKLAGAGRVISPPAIAGEMLAKSALNPDVIDLITDVSELAASDASFGQVAVQPGSWLAGRTLAEIGQLAPGALVVMVKEGDRVTTAPRGTQRIEPGMILVVVGEARSVKALFALESPRNAED